MNVTDIILLDGSHHNSISEAVEYLVNKKLAGFEKRLTNLEKRILKVDPPLLKVDPPLVLQQIGGGAMPFKSEAQRRWMYANKPAMAQDWEQKTPSTPLPEHVGRNPHGTAGRGVNKNAYKRKSLMKYKSRR